MRDTARDREREREAETQAEREAGSIQGARCGTPSWGSRIMPWAEGRCLTAGPPELSTVLFLKAGKYNEEMYRMSTRSVGKQVRLNHSLLLLSIPFM